MSLAEMKACTITTQGMTMKYWEGADITSNHLLAQKSIGDLMKEDPIKTEMKKLVC